MNKTERRCAGILEALNEEGRLQVAELAVRCSVSLVTIRKDLTLLEERGLIRREQGCALLNEKTSMARRLTANYTAKCRLAEKAASLVEDGETVLIESGSCCILLAETLSRSRKNVTIVTNSVFMADYVGKRGYARIILLGGDYQPDSEAVVGPLTKMGAQTFHVRSFFCGAGRVLPETIISGRRRCGEWPLLLTGWLFWRKGQNSPGRASFLCSRRRRSLLWLRMTAWIPGCAQRWKSSR